MDYKLLGERIRKQRVALGLTQERLAELIGISTSYVGHIERGSRKASIDTLVAMANAMGVTANDLLGANLQNSSLFSQKLTTAQRNVMQEIVATLRCHIDAWPVKDDDEED